MAGPVQYPNQPPANPPQPGFAPPPGPPGAGWQHAAGLGPYGAPPPPPPEGWQATRPTSGKAVAALVCGIAGIIVGVLCPVGYVAIPVGLVLGILGIVETGANGRRSGRGLAIAGTVVSALAVAGAIGVSVFMFSQMRKGQESFEQGQAASVEQDIKLIVSRLQEYHAANGSLAPGGPFLAGTPLASENLGSNSGKSDPAFEGSRSDKSHEVTGVKDGKVVVSLRIAHLVREDELSSDHGLGQITLTVTGESTATLVIRGYFGPRSRGERTIEVTDAATGRWVETGE